MWNLPFTKHYLIVFTIKARLYYANVFVLLFVLAGCISSFFYLVTFAWLLNVEDRNATLNSPRLCWLSCFFSLHLLKSTPRFIVHCQFFFLSTYIVDPPFEYVETTNRASSVAAVTERGWRWAEAKEVDTVLFHVSLPRAHLTSSRTRSGELGHCYCLPGEHSTSPHCRRRCPRCPFSAPHHWVQPDTRELTKHAIFIP